MSVMCGNEVDDCDYKKTFDTINRSTFCSKVLASEISGKLFDVVKNIKAKQNLP